MKRVILSEDGLYDLLSHEIKHQVDISKGVSKRITKREMERRADSFAKNHWSYSKSKTAQELIKQHENQ